MLLGEYAHTLDDKNRLTLPAKFRESFVDGGVVTRGLDGCLYLFARQQWENLVSGRLAELDPLLEETRLMNRYFFSGAAEAEPDKQGRINVPAALIEHAHLGREVVVAGVQDHLEAVFLDIASRYDVDGIHFDFVRYPNPDFSYSRTALEHRRDETVHPPL